MSLFERGRERESVILCVCEIEISTREKKNGLYFPSSDVHDSFASHQLSHEVVMDFNIVGLCPQRGRTMSSKSDLERN